jgi:two-component system response regulator DevR
VCEVESRIYLLAENRLFRDALTRILNKKGQIRVVGAGPLNAESEARVSELGPDILLSDSAALVNSEPRIIPALRTKLPGLRIIMIGMSCDRETLLYAIRGGAQGYVLKDASAAEVASAVRAVINGEAVCPTSMLPVPFDLVAQSQAPHPSAHIQRELGLSRREQQLIYMISEGLTNKEIASALGLSQQTVKNHVHRMLRKVGAGDRLSIVERWHEVRHSAPGVYRPSSPASNRARLGE